MNSPILFSENQRFKQWWLWLILLAVDALFLFGVVQQVVLGNQFGDNPMSDTGLCIVAGMMLVITLIFGFSQLQTIITEEGVFVRLMPFHFRFRRYTWDQFSNMYIREYSPITEYGGWGLRHSISGYGKAYNMAGKQGLQLVFQNGKKLLIGTQKAEELKAVLEKRILQPDL
ncbi:MAG: hypothetical protein V4604_13145 [Bacteroidota bacterium]